jgi:peptide chain release factor 1
MKTFCAFAVKKQPAKWKSYQRLLSCLTQSVHRSMLHIKHNNYSFANYYKTVNIDFMSENKLLDKLKGIKIRFEETGQQITNPEVIADIKKFIALNKEYRELEPIAAAATKYENIIKNIESTKEMLEIEKDPELLEMVRTEIEELSTQLTKLEDEIKILLIPVDPQDSKNAILEIRAGTGGDEASIFAGDLFRMYQRFIEKHGWKSEVTSFSDGSAGGYKEIIMKVSGQGVYGILKYESGVHRVQRVPQTETMGRVHTSAATIAVLPEAEEFDVELNMNDIRKDTFCASGPGGQSVNTTYSAIRLTHIPTGTVVQCQDEKSQIKNFEKALAELRTRIYNIEYQKIADEIAGKRKTMVSTGDRSAKIRTYNYSQSRVTDHRINYTMYNLPAFIDGDIQECIDLLQIAENAERLKETDL